MPGLQNDPSIGQQEAGFGFDGNFWAESRNIGVTAAAAGTQAAAPVINAMVTQVTVAANATAPFASIALPGARLTLIGVTICVINAAANPIQLFGTGNDTVNGAAGATGVTMQGNSIAYFVCVGAPGVNGATAGAWIATGLGFGYASGAVAGFTTYSTATGITAHAGGGQAAAVLLTATQNQITTVANANDSVRLPPAQPGLEIAVVNNAAANSLNVFPSSQTQGGATGGDSMNGTQNAAQAVTAGTVTIFFCFVAGLWVSK